eukprot:TRINITY_DN2839_c0_g1_i1.p1 TRINITY_DN2839_c0_g1~~TRINITY_DN2839_c0_g1_i1.p1  ORF type:complete len:186 (-),score=12.74 TRINITY_DN2839_c0_g1_i1:96-599(-)
MADRKTFLLIAIILLIIAIVIEIVGIATIAWYTTDVGFGIKFFFGLLKFKIGDTSTYYTDSSAIPTALRIGSGVAFGCILFAALIQFICVVILIVRYMTDRKPSGLRFLPVLSGIFGIAGVILWIAVWPYGKDGYRSPRPNYSIFLAGIGAFVFNWVAYFIIPSDHM